MDLAACEIMGGADDAFRDGTEGEGDVVDVRVAGVELAFRGDTATAARHVKEYWSGASCYGLPWLCLGGVDGRCCKWKAPVKLFEGCKLDASGSIGYRVVEGRASASAHRKV